MENFVSSPRIVGVVSKKEFEVMSNSVDGQGIVVISIIDPENATPVPADLLSHYDDVLQMQFWDLEEPIGRFKIINEEEAKIIFDFINKNKDKRFFIHCMAGMSRSAGVARAVECICDFDSDVYFYSTSSSPVKDHPRYTANMVIFDKIMSNV